MKLKKSYSPEPLSQFQTILEQSILGWRLFKFLQMKNQLIFIKLIMFLSSLNQPYNIIICGYWHELFSQVSDVAYGPLVHVYNILLSETSFCKDCKDNKIVDFIILYTKQWTYHINGGNKKEYKLCVSLYIFWSLNTRLKNMPQSKNYSIQLLKNGVQPYIWSRGTEY